MSKSLGYYVYTGEQQVTAGNPLPLTTTVRQFGKYIRLENNAVYIKNPCSCSVGAAAGYYTVSVNTSLVTSETGLITVALYQDNVAVPGAFQTLTVGTSGDTINISFTVPIRVFCGTNQSVLTIVVESQTVTTTNVAIEVVKE